MQTCSIDCYRKYVVVSIRERYHLFSFDFHKTRPDSVNLYPKILSFSFPPQIRSYSKGSICFEKKYVSADMS